ncbi:MAG: FAD-dependent oxidoreductase [Candidatus Ranarchaeia archaeon]
MKKIIIRKPQVEQFLITPTGEEFFCNHFFVAFVAEPRMKLAYDMGINTDNHGCIATDHRGKTNVKGVWAAGDVRAITQSVAMAVGTGNYAAIMVNKFLERKSFHGTTSDHPEERLYPIKELSLKESGE